MANEQIKYEMFRKKIPQWKLANVLGISETTMGRKLRVELSDTKREEILNIIENWSENNG